jgi:NADH-quinone oxidoreductase subunit A
MKVPFLRAGREAPGFVPQPGTTPALRYTFPNDTMLSSYGPVALFFIVAAIFPVVPLLLNRLLAPRRPDRVKLSPYESGVETIGPTHIQFRTRYYLYALIFVIFDVEAIYLFPWAVAFNQLGLFALVEMAIFIGFLLVAFIYAWRKRALEWV